MTGSALKRTAMAGTWTTERFPQFSEPIQRLAEQHRELKDEPLHLAVSYGPAREQQDIFLFEVIGGTESINPEGDLFETTFLPASGFPMGPEQKLHLILTNPQELHEAIDKGWPLAKEIIQAVRSPVDHKVLFADRTGKDILEHLKRRRRRPVRG
jgi:hypothetical protein